jgi:hypothetical protein
MFNSFSSVVSNLYKEQEKDVALCAAAVFASFSMNISSMLSKVQSGMSYSLPRPFSSV